MKLKMGFVGNLSEVLILAIVNLPKGLKTIVKRGNH